MKISTFLVEDSLLIRQQLIPALSDLGNAHVMGCAEGETEAKKWLNANAHKCRLAIIDLFLNEGSGFGVIAACKQLPVGLTVVLLTNHATTEMRRRALSLGANAVFDKSTELEEFFAFCTLIKN